MGTAIRCMISEPAPIFCQLVPVSLFIDRGHRAEHCNRQRNAVATLCYVLEFDTVGYTRLTLMHQPLASSNAVIRRYP